jgi:hypothetical protein
MALIDLLQAKWADYTAEALPREVYEAEEGIEDQDDQAG